MPTPEAAVTRVLTASKKRLSLVQIVAGMNPGVGRPPYSLAQVDDALHHMPTIYAKQRKFGLKKNCTPV